MQFRQIQEERESPPRTLVLTCPPFSTRFCTSSRSCLNAYDSFSNSPQPHSRPSKSGIAAKYDSSWVEREKYSDERSAKPAMRRSK